jgi:hypothetical protein
LNVSHVFDFQVLPIFQDLKDQSHQHGYTHYYSQDAVPSLDKFHVLIFLNWNGKSTGMATGMGWQNLPE